MGVICVRGQCGVSVWVWASVACALCISVYVRTNCVSDRVCALCALMCAVSSLLKYLLDTVNTYFSRCIQLMNAPCRRFFTTLFS